jgi:hypothetical protein
VATQTRAFDGERSGGVAAAAGLLPEEPIGAPAAPEEDEVTGTGARSMRARHFRQLRQLLSDSS